MAENILDFNDYAKPVDFKFQDSVYRIPAFPKKKIEMLMKFNNEFVKKQNLDEEIDPEAEVDQESMDKTFKFFDQQDEFLAMAVLKKEGDTFKEVTVAELSEWPVRVKTKVMSEVTKQMSAVAEDDTSKKS